MKSIREIYKIGIGPSSSHTMGPERACKYMMAENPEANRFKVVLYGSLSSTGKGHRTDHAIECTLSPFPVEIIFDTSETDLPHANTMDFYAYRGDTLLAKKRILSVGGGDVRIEGHPEADKPEIYDKNSFKEIADYCRSENIRLSDYVFAKCANPHFFSVLPYIRDIFSRDTASVHRSRLSAVTGAQPEACAGPCERGA